MADLFVGDRSKRRHSPRSPSHAATPDRTALVAKLWIGALGGGIWGYYVSVSSDVDWPRTALSFAIIGAIAGVLRLAQVSTENFADSFRSPFLRRVISFTPERFGDWSLFSLVTAVAVLVGFLIAG